MSDAGLCDDYDDSGSEPMFAYDSATGYVWSFKEWNDGEARIIGVEGAQPGVLRIPSTLIENSTRDRYTVSSIGDYAFGDMADISSIVLPSSVIDIGYGAFSGTGITTFTVPETVKGFALEAFSGCKQLETLEILSPYIRKREEGYGCSLSDCPNLKSLTFPPSLWWDEEAYGMSPIDWDGVSWRNDDYIFVGYWLRLSNLPRLESLIVPENVTVFYISRCENLSAIRFPSTLKALGDYWSGGFYGLWKLDKVIFASALPRSVDMDIDILLRDSLDGFECLLAFANSVYYPAAYADQWKKILRNLGYGGTHGVYTSQANMMMSAMVRDAPKYASVTVPDFGPFVVGVAAEQTMPSAAGYTMTGLPLGFSWNSASGTLSGTARNAGQFEVTLRKNGVSQTMTLRADPSDVKLADLSIDVEDQYETSADGTFELTIPVMSASTPKIFVKGLPTGLKYDSKKNTISGKATKPGVYVVTVSATNATVKKPVTATFEIVMPNLTSEKLPNLNPEREAYGMIFCGAAFNPKLVDCTPEKDWTVKVAGLPTGLKYDAKTGTITGVPTKAGTFTVTFTASKKGEANQVATITLKTEALPLWAQGTFSGCVMVSDAELDYEARYGSATMTVTANGKISGKIVLDGTNWAFSAANYASFNGNDCFDLEVEAKAGKATMPVRLEVGNHMNPPDYALMNGLVSGSFGDYEMTLWRNVWKDKVTAAMAKEEIAKWEGVYTMSLDAQEDDHAELEPVPGRYGYLSLKVGKNGDVKASGKLSDGTAVSATSPLMYAYGEDRGWFVLLYAAPPAYKGGNFVAAVRFVPQKAAVQEMPRCLLERVFFPPQWTSCNPQATGEYGKGFMRRLKIQGAYYDTANKLNDYYESLRLATEAPVLVTTGKETFLDESKRKKTRSMTVEVDAADTLGQVGLTVAVNEKGQFEVEKATQPVQNKETKVWSYTGANDGGLTLSFTQATGIFKGSYTFWYDYLSAFDQTTGKETWTHTSKKVNFEGIMVQGAESLGGFYLWDATGSYDDPKTGNPKTYKYKQSFPVNLKAQ